MDQRGGADERRVASERGALDAEPSRIRVDRRRPDARRDELRKIVRDERESAADDGEFEVEEGRRVREADADRVRGSGDGGDGDGVALPIRGGELLAVVPDQPCSRAHATMCGPEARCSTVAAAASPSMSATTIWPR